MPTCHKNRIDQYFDAGTAWNKIIDGSTKLRGQTQSYWTGDRGQWKSIRTVDELHQRLKAKVIGRSIELGLLRNGQRTTLKAIPQK